MARFCTQCGSANEIDAGFCDSCGHQLMTVAPATKIEQTTISGKVPGKISTKAMYVFSAAGIAGLLIVGSVAWTVLNTGLSKNTAEQVMSNYFRDHPQENDALVCLANLDYDKNPVTIQTYDVQSRGWLDTLVAAGLYNSAKNVPGAWNFNFLQYTYTDVGKAAIRGKRLCLASAIKMHDLRIDSSADTAQGERTKVFFHYELADPAPWVKGKIQELADRSLRMKRERVAILERQDNQWMMREPSQINSSMLLFKIEQKKSGFASLFDNILHLFPAQNPILGTWRMKKISLLDDTPAIQKFIFSETEANFNGQVMKVHYEINENKVRVSSDGETAGQDFQVRDHDHIVMVTAFGEIPFERTAN